MNKFEQFEKFIEKYPFLKGGNNLHQVSHVYGIELEELEYCSSWVQGVYEMWDKEIREAKEVIKFYADSDNYIEEKGRNNLYTVICQDADYLDIESEDTLRFGGKRARDYFKGES